MSLIVLSRSIPFLPREYVWDFPRGRLFLANHIRGSLLHTFMAVLDGLFLFTALFVCAFFVRDRTSTTMHGTSRSASRCRTFGVTTHSKLIRMSSIGIWVCHTSHEVKTPWMSRSYIHGVCESIASRSGARFVQGVRCIDL